jgi:hypothetical protein
LASVVISASFAVLMGKPLKPGNCGSSAEWLAEINLVLALFNHSAFPLMVERSALSAVGISGFSKATRVASVVGRPPPSCSFLVECYSSLRASLPGLWTGLIGWFLWAASRQNQRQADLRIHSQASLLPT